MIDVGALFEDYARRYMAGDAEGVASLLYAAPFLAVRGGRPIWLADRAAVVGHLGEVMAAYQRSGAAVAEVAGIEVMTQGEGALLATVHWQVRRVDGSVVRDFRTSYQLALAEPARIVSYVNHDPLAGQ